VLRCAERLQQLLHLQLQLWTRVVAGMQQLLLLLWCRRPMRER
jgi:hypothetical protein